MFLFPFDYDNIYNIIPKFLNVKTDFVYNRNLKNLYINIIIS